MTNMTRDVKRGQVASEARVEDSAGKRSHRKMPIKARVQTFRMSRAPAEMSTIAEDEIRALERELSVARAETEAERFRYRELFDLNPDAHLVTDKAGMIGRGQSRGIQALCRSVPLSSRKAARRLRSDA